jgi:hypothetical protein
MYQRILWNGSENSRWRRQFNRGWYETEFWSVIIAVVVVGIAFRAEGENGGNVLVLDVYSANTISKEIGERTFFG